MAGTHGDFSPEARDRAHRTAAAADVYADHAEVIVAALAGVPAGHVLVAVVEADHRIGAMHAVGTAEIVTRVPQLEEGGRWAMVFSPGSSADDVRRRSGQMADIARQRVAAIDRITARRAGPDGSGSR
ncbi:MAG: hypothetical protein EPN43_05210 [Jatrophihabitans sp.]|nr:MAG: hypothetical protein EPN43_05210 [Jatrophihabitans sp.]